MSLERTRQIESHLDGSVESLKSLSERPLRDATLQSLAERTYQLVVDTLSVGTVFFDGFKAVRAGAIRPSRESALVPWITSPGVELRSGRLVANMIALELCAAMDDVLPKVVERGKKSSPVFRRRWQKMGGAEIRVRVSARKGRQWPKVVFELMDITVDPLVIEALLDLKGARNCGAHELPLGDAHFWGEHPKVWTQSCLWLLSKSLRAVDDMIRVTNGRDTVRPAG